MRRIAALTDGVIVLREITPEDVETLYKLRVDPASRPMFRDSGVIPWESHQKMIAGYFDPAENSAVKDRWFMIEVAGKEVGTIALYAFDQDESACEVGRFAVEPEFRKHGYGKRALSLLFEHARVTGINKIRCQVFAANAPALGLCREFHFLQTGVGEHGGRELIDLTAEVGTSGQNGG